MPSVVQINFKYDVSEEELENRASPESAAIFRQVPGLRWKIWSRDAESHESSGIYLFDDRDSAQAYVDGPIAEMIKAMPDTENHIMKILDVREDLTAITGGPINHSMHEQS